MVFSFLTITGTSWRPIDSGLSFGIINSLAVSGENIFAGDVYNGHQYSYGSVYLSTNMGVNWNSVFNRYCYTMVISDTKVLVGTSSGVFLSSDNGTHWTCVNSGLSDYNIVSLAVSGTNIFAGTNQENVYLLANSDTSWRLVNSGLPTSIYNPINTFAVSGNNLFAGTGLNGIYLSTNTGANWTAVNSGLPLNIYPFVVMALATSGTYLFASINADGSLGLWRRPLSELTTTISENKSDKPKIFTLLQNHPNPFNPATIISFSISVKTFVSLKVFDIMGKEVTTIISEEMSEGAYSKTWNATNIPSGVYFYRLHAGSFTETKKLVLLK